MFLRALYPDYSIATSLYWSENAEHKVIGYRQVSLYYRGCVVVHSSVGLAVTL